MQYVSFYVGLSSLSTVSSCSITSLHPTVLYPLPDGGHRVIYVTWPLWTLLWHRECSHLYKVPSASPLGLPRRGRIESHGSSIFDVLNHFRTSIHSGCTNFHFHQQQTGVHTLFSISLPMLTFLGLILAS